MGIINWMQDRFNAKQDKKRPVSAVVSSARDVPTREVSCRGQDAREEKSAGDWPPQGLLSIGTLGNESPAAAEGGGTRAASHDVPDFTIEEVKKLQDALNKLLRRAKSKSSPRGSTAAADEENLPLDRFLNCPSSLEVDRRVPLKLPQTADGEFSPDTRIILSKARDLLVNSNNGTMKQKSLKFLLKKMFVCRGGFAPAPSLKDPVESRMEKLFRTMLHRRTNYARPSNAASSRKYYLEDKPRGKTQRDRRHDEEDDDNGGDVFKWDKTDSDFIVLEV